MCQCDGNLLAAAGEDGEIKVYDRRESKIVKVLDQVHSSEKQFC